MPHLVAPRGDDHGLQPLVGHAQVEGGQLAQLTCDPLHNLSVDLGNLVLKQGNVIITNLNNQ